MTTAQLELTGSEKKSDDSDLVDGLSKPLRTNNKVWMLQYSTQMDTEYRNTTRSKETRKMG